ncbi:inactive protein RESTRICTED TEV MOVEMENT 1-like [Macadamia integrifolia]|uniref:inactive protein RESTRICTED TEV MOVEMENT 1-like n=1 Tax=Macadamia integrifolia TaxID=60698 RepID=UPI001C4FCA32|nr:inactive protein RESTRICTED TEV MOVEMENT 1-like [Macadamia integrifolia]
MEMMIKVGPYGWKSRGNPWDEKGQSMVTQIFIFYDSETVYSIQIAYILDGKLQLSNIHGGKGNMFETVDIDYPSEFLTGITGYTDGYYGKVASLTFETNQRKFGPFGLEEGNNLTPFRIKMGTKRIFAGFHGSSDTNYLYLIGVYVKPINPLEDTKLNISKLSIR